ncbi:hypothetical protein HETIRDRAFT_107638 [Heterobasidion irregulare TC 32-1]|uniref:Uncharacterized protein n=1 Tax=Heterobasidion irregulare (strain TC 32-1) TaxID=747525 RepID=W4JWS5_HETIT|nr:uncharacterized protein HETIRDRAFT_107638 [Heterobasidion irregulare TC 32-1]ETW78018.1 hypothetical protein HETIRDRAFT_107638 [Heterobasidion irregulare TC 32-1]
MDAANLSRNFMGQGQPPKNRMVLGTIGLVALTAAAYYWGYRDVDKRHPEMSPEKHRESPV